MARKTAPKPTPVPAEVRKALADRKSTADSEALLAELLDVWGGPRKLALDLHAEFQTAAKGGMTRQRILEMIQRLIITNTTHDLGKSITPSDMETDELERVAMTYLKRMNGDAPPPAAG